MDANDYEQHATMWDAASATMGGVDTILIAHGTLSNQQECEKDAALALAEITTNALSVIALLTLIANRLEVQRAGTIAVISSVAGDRIKPSNYVYGSSKAMVTAFASGLRLRLQKSNVAVVTIKPGFVDTPMTKEFKKGFLWATPAAVAQKLVQAIDKKRGVAYAPAFWWVIMAIIKLLPDAVVKKV